MDEAPNRPSGLWYKRLSDGFQVTPYKHRLSHRQYGKFARYAQQLWINVCRSVESTRRRSQPPLGLRIGHFVTSSTYVIFINMLDSSPAPSDGEFSALLHRDRKCRQMCISNP